MQASDINSIQSESGIIATLIKHPEFAFHSEDLQPQHFSNRGNMCVYAAIVDLVHKGITKVDPYNIIEDLNSNETMRSYVNSISLERLNEMMGMSDILARGSIEEYKMLVSNVVDAAFRREILEKLQYCQRICGDLKEENVQQKIYNTLDEVLCGYSTVMEVPEYKDVIDECWAKIVERQGCGYSGIPFKFETLNNYATIETGELFIFAAEAKQGKSIMLLNCAIDLLKQDYSVLYLDSELNDRLFTARVCAHLSGVEYRRVTSGNYTSEEEQRIKSAISWMKTRKFTHMYIPAWDLQTLYTVIKRYKYKYGLDILIVDYFKSNGDSLDAFGTYQELGKFVDMVKNKICGDMQVAGLGAAQATAAGRIADSAKIGRNASTVALIQDKTPQEIQADGLECGNKKLTIILNRNGCQHGPGEYISLKFDGNHILYEEAKQQMPCEPF